MASEDMIERLQRLRLDAVLAIEASDYDTAYTKLFAARTIIETAATRQEKDGLSLEFPSLESLMARVEKERAKVGGHGKVRRIPVRHYQPSTCDCE